MKTTQYQTFILDISEESKILNIVPSFLWTFVKLTENSNSQCK